MPSAVPYCTSGMTVTPGSIGSEGCSSVAVVVTSSESTPELAAGVQPASASARPTATKARIDTLMIPANLVRSEPEWSNVARSAQDSGDFRMGL